MRVKTIVPMDEAKRRAMLYLMKCPKNSLTPANCVFHAIWPDSELRSQGAGAAASRILVALQKDELARWHGVNKSDGTALDWGWEATQAGREFAKNWSSLGLNIVESKGFDNAH